MSRLDEIKERCAGATPGPWKRIARTSTSMTGVHSKECKIYHATLSGEALKETHARQRRDAEFIAHAREDIPYLLAENERLENELRISEHNFYQLVNILQGGSL